MFEVGFEAIGDAVFASPFCGVCQILACEFCVGVVVVRRLLGVEIDQSHLTYLRRLLKTLLLSRNVDELQVQKSARLDH